MGCSTGWAARSAAPAACRARSCTRPGRWPDASAAASAAAASSTWPAARAAGLRDAAARPHVAARRVVVDPCPPPSALALHQALAAAWPRVPRVRAPAAMARRRSRSTAGDVVVSCHACGALTDRVLDAAAAAGARVAVMPCCHDVRRTRRRRSPAGSTGRWPSTSPGRWRLERRGYTVWTQAIPPEITPKHRLLCGPPPARQRPAARWYNQRHRPCAGTDEGAAMVSRRAFLGFAAAMPLAGEPWDAPRRAAECAASAGGGAGCGAPARSRSRSSRRARGPTGCRPRAEGLWIIDQGPGSRAYLVRYGDGQVIRSFDTDTVRPSGITFDGQALWIGSTFSYENVRCDATTGAVLERRPTPGCTTYQMADDPAPRRSPLARPAAAASAPPAAPARAAPPPRPAHPGAAPPLPGRPRPGMARRQAVDDVDVVAIDLSHRPAALGGRTRAADARDRGRTAWPGKAAISGTTTATSTRSSSSTSTPGRSSRRSSSPTAIRSPMA